MSRTVTLVAVIWPGDCVPGPPRVPIMIRPASIGAAGLMVATTKVGPSLHANAAAELASAARPLTTMLRNMNFKPPLYSWTGNGAAPEFVTRAPSELKIHEGNRQVDHPEHIQAE